MKIAYITSQYPFGPGEAFLHAEAEALARLSEDVLVIPARPKTRESRHPDLTARVLRLAPWGPRTLLLAALEALFHPQRALQALAGVVGTPYRLSTKLKNLAIFPKALAVARTIRAERIVHVHAQWLSTPSTVAYFAATMTGVKWSCTAHQFDIFEDNLLTQKVSSAAFVRTISARNRDLIVSLSGGAASARCHVVHLGVVLPPQASSLLQHPALRVLCPAMLVPKKGHRYLMEALAILRSSGVTFTCDLVGDGPLRKILQGQIASLGLSDRVHLRGTVAHDRLMAELTTGAYDVVALASIESGSDFEGIPVALMEAMAAGIPCVATDTGSISELIDSAACSTLVPQRDPQALAAAIAAHVDVPRRRQLGERARERVVQAFDVRETTSQLYRMMCAS